MTASPSRDNNEDYFGIRISPGEQLAERYPQAAVRARLYRLEDDGASDLARRKRSIKESIATRRDTITRIEERQAGKTNLPPRPQEQADQFIAAHREAIRKLEERLADVAPAANIIAPMTRRVAREDRRRARKKRLD
jgi:small-conductance mechanosensitive channel